MKYYLASRFSRHPEMRQIRDQVVALRHEVTSTWHDRGEIGDALDQRIYRNLDGYPELAEPFAREDIRDIAAADVVVSITPPDGGGRGGRHVEFGIALGAGKAVHVVGPREHIFHTLAAHFDTVDDWLRSIAAEP